MKNSNAILINYAENCLHQMAEVADDLLSAVLSADDLLMFQQRALCGFAIILHCKPYPYSYGRRSSGKRLDEAGPEARLWHDRRVVLTDGSTLSMPDSQDNQAVYPQPSTPKKNSVFRS